MLDSRGKTLLIFGGTAVLVSGLLLLRPWYFSDSSSLTMLIGAEILLAAIANYRKAYFPFLLFCFLWAGTTLPFDSELLQARWIALAAGVIVGVAIYMKDRNHSFGAFHLLALTCVLSAFVSASVSAYPNEAILKALSLGLLFAYSATGVRSGFGVPKRSLSTLLTGCEVLTWVTAICYFALGAAIFGNPNSLGAIAGIAIIPMLLWGLLSAETRARRLRLQVELLIALLLLLSSFARAAIGAVVVSSLLVLIGLRQYRMMIKGVVLVAVLAICAIPLASRYSEAPTSDDSDSTASVFLYKGKRQQGFLGSRRSTWQQTWDAIYKNPWFGTGFGTSATSRDLTGLNYAERHIDSWVVREHGNSYLAILEWTGLLGVVPFFLLLGTAASSLIKGLVYLRRTGDVSSPIVPATAIVAAGLIHGTFEDWVFAVGYHMCLFFWAFAFLLVDLLTRSAPAHAPVVVAKVDIGCSIEPIRVQT